MWDKPVTSTTVYDRYISRRFSRLALRRKPIPFPLIDMYRWKSLLSARSPNVRDEHRYSIFKGNKKFEEKVFDRIWKSLWEIYRSLDILVPSNGSKILLQKIFRVN